MDKIESKLANLSPEQLSGNAQHIWQMLDDMADNDPAAYRKFIDKQMEESKKFNVKPKPHMCIETKVTSPFKSLLYINVFDWETVPEPKSDEDPIPVIGGALYDGKDDTGVYKIVTVAFNPKLTTDFGINSPNYRERNMLIGLAIDFLQDSQKCVIARDYKILPKPQYKGSLVKAIETVTKRNPQQQKEIENQIGDLENMFGKLNPGEKGSMFDQLGNITLEETDDAKYSRDDPEPEVEESESVDGSTQSFSSSSGQSKNSGKPNISLVDNATTGSNLEKNIRMPGAVGVAKKTNKDGGSLIEEVGVESGRSLIEPEYNTSFRQREGADNLCIKVVLPGIMSVSDCQLDISKTDLHLLVTDQFELNLPFERSVDESEAGAKFSKKTSTLTLTIPILA